MELLTIFTIVALDLTLIYTYRELQRVREENKRYRWYMLTQEEAIQGDIQNGKHNN